MRAVAQRVTKASVGVDGSEVSSIGVGLMVLIGIGADDRASDVDYIVQKVSNLRIFEDEQGKMNRSVLDIGGEMLLVSQFTLYGDARGGRRPSFSAAARGEVANELFESVVEGVRAQGICVQTGRFGAHMTVDLVNNGPVTILLDSTRQF